jgi:DNA-binding response OmpR family regulator
LANLLSGMRILILEDEFLIAMDVEQLCRDNGAADAVIARNLDEIDEEQASKDFDAAILDVMLGGASTLPFAKKIHENGVPFIFASGYADVDEIFTAFPGVLVVGKPYSGTDLIEALAATAGRLPDSGGV